MFASLLYTCALVHQCGDEKYAVRHRAHEKLYEYVMQSGHWGPLTLNYGDPEINARCQSVLSRYRDIGEIPKGYEIDLYSGNWEDLYFRATGKKLDNRGVTWSYMPDRLEEEAMIFRWLQDRWDEGFSRDEVMRLLGRK